MKASNVKVPVAMPSSPHKVVKPGHEAARGDTQRKGVARQPSGGRVIAGIASFLRDARTIALLGSVGAVALGVGARLGFAASLLESVFLSASCLCLGLGAASFIRLSRELGVMKNALDHTRKHMATTARVLSETLEQAELLTHLSSETESQAPRAAPAQEGSHQVHLEGLANVARAQVILAHKSEADIGVLSNLVSELAEAMAEQEKELSVLRAGSSSAKAEAELARKEVRETTKTIRQLLMRDGSAARNQSLTANAADRLQGGEARLHSKALPDDSRLAASETPLDRQLVLRMENAINASDSDIALQPIVTLPQRKVRFYELSLALKNYNTDIEPGQLRRAAQEAGTAAQYDRLLVSRAVRIIRYFRSKKKDITILCEVTGSMLVANPAFDELIGEMRRDKDIASSLIIGFSQQAYSNFRQAELDLLRFFTEMGAKFAITNISDMRLDPLALSNNNVRMVTIHVARMLEALPTGLPGLDLHVADLAGLFARRNIDFIVQNIATEQELLDIMDMDAPLAQGKLLGEPRPINPELVEATQITTSLPPTAPPPPERQPLRNFLRRA